MNGLNSSPVEPRVVRWGKWFHRNFLIVLVATYTLAGIAPRVGSVIREYEVGLPGGGVERVSMLLLAVLLFCAAAVIDWEQIAEVVHRPSILAVGLAAAWIGPVLLVVVLGPIISRMGIGQATSGVLVGLALVAAMPVANSSAGWTQNAGGNVALSLGLIVVSIILSPLITPTLLDVTGGILAHEDKERIERVVTQFSGWRFMLWVILPSLVGAFFAWTAGEHRIAAAKPWFRIVTLSTIIVLNYANSSLAVETLWAREKPLVVLVAAGLAVLVSLVGIGLAVVQARLFKLPKRSLLALMFGLSMKHTGLALVLAGEFLKDQPRAILVVLLTTLAQHVVAGLVDQRAHLDDA